MKIKFGKWNCNLVKARYENNRIALVLENADYPEHDDDPSPIATATVNLPEYPLADDEVIIKDYSENKGMLQCLMNYKIIGPPVVIIHGPFVDFPVCKILHADFKDV